VPTWRALKSGVWNPYMAGTVRLEVDGARATIINGDPDTACRILHHLAVPEVIAAMDEEMITQTFIARSDDLAELRTARAEDRVPHDRGS
jgi:hypothetical protein